MRKDSNEDMKIRADDRKWLTNEIAGQVEKAIAIAADEFKPHGWRRVAQFVREWGIAGTIITAFLALLGIAAVTFYQATARIGKEAAF